MTPQNMPIAPSATVRHVDAFKRQKPFELSWTVRVLSTHNPWRPSSHGFNLFEQVLRVRTETTIAQILQDAEAVGYYRSDVMRFLRWLYTWGDFLEINGQQYFPAKTEDQPDEAPRKRKRS